MLREDWSIEKLFPPQAEALPHALSGRNVILTIPTASGKSLVAYLAIVHRLTSDHIEAHARMSDRSPAYRLCEIQV